MPEALLQALLEARVYDLEQPRYRGAPTFPAHEPGFNLFLHRRHERGGEQEGRTSASALIVATEHSGTHIDALCHQAEGGVLCDGREVDASIQGPDGISHLDAASIAPLRARGVLVDVPAALEGEPVPDLIGRELLERALEAQRVELRAGDAVLVRTGNGALFGDRARYEAGPGIAGEASAWLASTEPLLVGSDTMAWDLPGHRDPELGCTLPGHVHLICRAGIYIVENLNLEQLAADGVFEFAFVCLPLKMRGATGSPVRPIALATP